MAVDTAAKRYAAMTPACPWKAVGVLPSGTVDAPARQAVRWLYNGILAQGGILIGYYNDMNTRLRVYLLAYYGLSGGRDLTTLTQQYLGTLSGTERTARMQRLIADATAAMTP
jgi:hypothetical protein